MMTLTATQARAGFDELLERAQHGSVQITRHGRAVGVLLSTQDYGPMRQFHAHRAQAVLAQSVSVAGLTDEALAAWLADERR